MSLGVCPEVSPKFWRLVGVFKSGFLIANRKLWSIAFQWYITWGGRCGWNGSNQGFCLKFWPKTMYFGGHKSGSSDFRGVWDPNILKCQHFWHYPSKIWVKTVKMSYGQAQSLQNCPKASLLLYFLDWTPKMAKKNWLICISYNYLTFWCRNLYMAGTMWKLTSWGFQKCNGF